MLFTLQLRQQEIADLQEDLATAKTLLDKLKTKVLEQDSTITEQDTALQHQSRGFAATQTKLTSMTEECDDLKKKLKAQQTAMKESETVAANKLQKKEQEIGNLRNEVHGLESLRNEAEAMRLALDRQKQSTFVLVEQLESLRTEHGAVSNALRSAKENRWALALAFWLLAAPILSYPVKPLVTHASILL